MKIHPNKPHITTNPSSYWRLIAAGEPYRLLFPIGTVIGIVGVLMWPIYVWNVSKAYPGMTHPRVMIEGFVTAFIIGFLGTALPRLLGVPRLTLGETITFALMVSVAAVLNYSGQIFWGESLFCLTLLALVGALGFRALKWRQDVPPPAFVLVLLGLACGFFGGLIQLLTTVTSGEIPVWLRQLGPLLVYQAYLVFPIMGIGAFLLPRFFGMPSQQDFPESLRLPPGWLPKAAFALACGAVVMAGFVLEAFGNPASGNALRAVGIAVYFFREIPAHKVRVSGSLAFGLRLALLSIPLAYALMAIWPGQRFALIHILMITGFSLITFIVASRVIYGHSGQTEKFRAGIWPVRILVAGIFLAMLTRVTAEWMPDIRMTHYGYAALAWIAAVLVWSGTVLRGVVRSHESDA